MQATGYFFRVCRFLGGPSVKRCSNLRVTVKPETDFFSFFSAKCQTVLKIEGVTRGPEVDLETPLRCFFEEIARRLHEKQKLNLVGASREASSLFTVIIFSKDWLVLLYLSIYLSIYWLSPSSPLIKSITSLGIATINLWVWIPLIFHRVFMDFHRFSLIAHGFQ